MTEWFKPKKFFCYFALKTGAFVIGILMCCMIAIITIYLLVQIINRSRVYPDSYAVEVVACFDCALMLVITGWFIWAVKREKTTVILIWLAATLLWLAHALVLVVVLIIFFASHANIITWIVCALLTVAAFAIAAYFLLCVFAYWLELREEKSNNNTPAQTAA